MPLQIFVKWKLDIKSHHLNTFKILNTYNKSFNEEIPLPAALHVCVTYCINSDRVGAKFSELSKVNFRTRVGGRLDLGVGGGSGSGLDLDLGQTFRIMQKINCGFEGNHLKVLLPPPPPFFCLY
jgi:hypothetical protein